MIPVASGEFVGKDDIFITTNSGPLTITLPFEVERFKTAALSTANGEQFYVSLGELNRSIEKITCSIPITVFAPAIITSKLMQGNEVIKDVSQEYSTSSLIPLMISVVAANSIFSIVLEISGEGSILISKNRTLTFFTITNLKRL